MGAITENDGAEQLALVSVGLMCSGISLDMFLRHAQGQPRFLWRSPNDARAIAGCGIAREISGWGAGRFAQVEAEATALFAGFSALSDAEPLLFGGFAFREDFVPDLAWAEFPPAHFVLPHFQLALAGQDCATLSLNAQVAPDEATPELIDSMRAALAAKRNALLAQPPASLCSSTPERNSLVDLAAWDSMITRALDAMRDTPLRKVVLARSDALHFDAAAPIDTALDRLNTAYPDTYRFLFEPAPTRAFFGATPELLLHLDGRMLHTMALAGSIARGVDATSDAELAGQLLASKKDRHEHQIVVDDIVRRLRELSSAVEIGPTGVLALKNIQHLHTPIHATLDAPHTALDLAARLHPTSALGGDPRELAMPLISTLEPVTRGWYAGPIGWIDRKLQGEFGVAIRSAVAQDARAWLYAGAGIVPASVPEYEWRETAIKFAPMLRALGAV